jgi:hypothetical protein
MNLSNLSGQLPTFGLLGLYIWSIAWKGLALWRCAELKQRNWFIGVLLLNTMGILEIAYLFFFAKKKLTLGELKFWEKK